MRQRLTHHAMDINFSDFHWSVRQVKVTVDL